MNTQRQIAMKTRLLAAAAATLALLAFGPHASASVVRIHFNGAMGSGYADLTVGPADALDTVDADHVPLAITDASGKFKDAKITGVQPLNYTPAPDGETLIPQSYSLFSIPGYGDHDGISYDNLFYPTGSPMICFIEGEGPGTGFVYPFSGGFLDLMGVMFMLDNGDFLDLWSYGNTDPGFFGPTWPGGLTYGMKVITKNEAGAYIVVPGSPFAKASVPEPDLLWLFGAGALGFFIWRRSRESRRLD